MNILVARDTSDCMQWQGNAVVVDVFRSATTVCALLQRGKTDIRLYGDKELAAEYKLARPEIELYSELEFPSKVKHEDNSPFAAAKSNAKTPAAIVTTAGTPAVMSLRKAKNIFMGGYCNISILASFLKLQGEDVLIVPSSLFGHVSDVEDSMCAEDFHSAIVGFGDIDKSISEIKQTARYEDFTLRGPKTALKDAKIALEANSLPVVPAIKIVGEYAVVATPATLQEAVRKDEVYQGVSTHAQSEPSKEKTFTRAHNTAAPMPVLNSIKPSVLKKKAVVLFSGGMDSTVCLYWALNKDYECHALSVSYGQKHDKEVRVARRLAADAGVKFTQIEIDLPWLAGATSLVGEGEIPQTAQEDIGKTVPSTYVPARNLMFAALGASLADSIGASALIMGPNAVDFSGYPDCTPEFYAPLTKAVQKGTKQGSKLEILTPLIELNKAEIVKLGRKLGAPLGKTWTCYKGGESPCGLCEACRLRAKGFEDAGEDDI